MAVIESTLIGIACLLTNDPSASFEKTTEKLSQAEVAQVEQLVSEHICLPEKLESLLNQNDQYRLGGTDESEFSAMGQVQPTMAC